MSLARGRSPTARIYNEKTKRRFTPAKTWRLVCALMRGTQVLVRDEVAKYHGRATNRNSFYQRSGFRRYEALTSELTDGGGTLYPRKVAVVVRRLALRLSAQHSLPAGRSSNR